ncbi:hypothetical protein QYF36_004865 [Acer negundo]|nr:hypothetical protein QYF36_004865 [Acer negundo]
MPPRKKTSSSSKKAQPQSSQSQPTKFGIQHFFDRHSQRPKVAAVSTAQNPKSDFQNPRTPTSTSSKNPENASDSAATATRFPPNSAFENTPPENLIPIDDDDDDNKNPIQVSPEISKSFPLKRFKFSPGMDDGGDEITWKISPVNEKLQAVSKLRPETIKSIQASPDTACKVDKWLSSPAPNATDRSLVRANWVGLKRVNPSQDADIPGIARNVNNTISSQQSPFRTPPSLSYCNDKPFDSVACSGASDQLGMRQHKKALLELLDQVEDAISVEDPVSSDMESHSFKSHDKNGDKMLVRSDPAVKRVAIGSPLKVNGASSNNHFLVLEVTEKRRPGDPVGAQSPYKVLRLLNEQSGAERAVYLWEEWFYTVIAPGDTVNVVGEFDDQGKCNVDHDNNLLVVHPDILVSGTRVAGSFNCPRRAVLDERLKGSEQSTVALIGTLLHQIFQAGLIKEVPTVNFLEECARIVLQKNIESLYACGVNENDILKTLIEAIPKLLNWITQFKDSQDSKGATVDFGSDNGIKNVKISESSMEHCAQVILYTLLMSERYLNHIDSGLLYYLQSDQTQGIMVRRSDVVGLIMRRNELANDILKASTMQHLPPMIRNPSMCRGCRHLDVCTIYHKAHGGNTESSGLGDVFDSHVHHLTTAHCVFLQHWDQLIDLEAKETQLLKNEIWRSRGLSGDQSTSCLSSIVLDTSKELLHQKSDKDNRFVYGFVRQDIPSPNSIDSNGESLNAVSFPLNDLVCTLRSGDYVILSTDSGHLAVANGFITDISRSHVSVSFSKRLRLPGSNASSEAHDLFQEVWRINKDEIMSSFSIMRFNLVQLFLQSAQSSQLRKIIVDLEAPRFDSGCIFSQDPAISYIWSEKNLNDDQRRAILKILTAKDYALILGMPGTGKTSTMVHAVKALLMRGATILLTSYTNSAIDNLLIKLKAQSIDFVRIGRHGAVHNEIQEHCLSEMKLNSVEEIKERIDQAKVVAVTCLGITNPLLANKIFDVCIMDEAGQTTLPVSLGPLMFASMFVLVGDHYQLPPLVQSTEARENGMEISLFRRLSEAHPQSISALQSQYRMCQGIMELSNALIYGDRLRCGSSDIANAKIEVSNMKSQSWWLKEVLNPSRPVIYINTDMLPAFEAKDQKTVNNPIEAQIVAKITEELVNNGIEGEDIGIITPYNSQVNLIRHALSMSSVEIHTIDKYQGRDKDCIVVSFVKSSENPKNCTSSLLGDWHRINVALTRAKKKLIMVGSRRTLSMVPLLKLLINKVEEQSGILSVTNKDMDHKVELRRCSQSHIR